MSEKTNPVPQSATALVAAPVTMLPSLAVLAAIPEEELWLANQRSRHTRRAYKEDVRHFMESFGIAHRDQLRQVGCAAVIAWMRKMEGEGERPRTICRRLSALSSLFQHLRERHVVEANPVEGVKRPAVDRNTGVTSAFDAKQARAILEAPNPSTLQGLRDRAILSVLLQAGPRRAEVATMRVRDFHQNMGYWSLRYTRKGGKGHSLSLHPQTAQRIQDYLKAAGHGDDLEGPLFRPVRKSWKKPEGDARRFLHPDGIDRLLRRYTKKALGLGRGFSAHSCRATFATNALANGCALEDVQQALGHADGRTTKLYDKRKDDPGRSAAFFANY